MVKGGVKHCGPTPSIPVYYTQFWPLPTFYPELTGVLPCPGGFRGVRGQLNGITTLIHQQREEMAQRHKLMVERWNEKQGHREEKEARQDEFIRLARAILHDREQERAEREAELVKRMLVNPVSRVRCYQILIY